MKRCSIQNLCLWLVVSTAYLISSGCATQTSHMSSIAPTGIETFGSEANDAGRLRNQSYESLISNGNQALQQGSYNLATIYFIKAQSLQPDSVPALTGLARTNQRLGNPQQARQDFLKALAIDDTNKTALVGLGRICRIQGEHDLAESYLRRALLDSPWDPEVLTEVAINYDSSGKGTVAEPLYLQVVKLQPDKAAALNNLGFNRILQGQYPAAIGTLLKAYSLSSGDKVIQNNLAAAYILNGEESMALDLFESSLGQAAAFNNIGYIYMTQENWAAAEKAFDKAMEISPSYYARAKKNLGYMKSLHAKADEQAVNPQP